MKELIEALEIRRKYNKMSFDEFANLYEKEFNVIISHEERSAWQFTGLHNVDYIGMNSK